MQAKANVKVMLNIPNCPLPEYIHTHLQGCGRGKRRVYSLSEFGPKEKLLCCKS